MSLSTRDLLDARDQYHWHLINKRNVVGTAIGLYPSGRTTTGPPTRSAAAARNAAKPNRSTSRIPRSGTTSWPCVLVLVDTWVDADQFGAGATSCHRRRWSRTLYLPDGRTVPVCVVQVDRPSPTGTCGLDLAENRYRRRFPADQQQPRPAERGQRRDPGHRRAHRVRAHRRHVAGPRAPRRDDPARHPPRSGGPPTGSSPGCPFSERLPRLSPHRRTYLTLDAALVEVAESPTGPRRPTGCPRSARSPTSANATSACKPGQRGGRSPSAPRPGTSGAGSPPCCLPAPQHRRVRRHHRLPHRPCPGQRGPSPGDSGTIWHLSCGPDDGTVQLRRSPCNGAGRASSPRRDQDFNFALAASLTNVLRLFDVSWSSTTTPARSRSGEKPGTTASRPSPATSSPRRNFAYCCCANRDRISFASPNCPPTGSTRPPRRPRRTARSCPWPTSPT